MSGEQNLNARDFEFNRAAPPAPLSRPEREEGGLFFRAGVAGAIISAVTVLRNWLVPAAAHESHDLEAGPQLAANQPAPPAEEANDNPEIKDETQPGDEEEQSAGSSTIPSILHEHPLFSAAMPIPLPLPLRRGGQNDNRLELPGLQFGFADTLSFRPGALNGAPGATGPSTGGGSSGPGTGGGGGGGGSDPDDDNDDGGPRKNLAPVISGPVLLGTLTLSSAMLIGLPSLLRNAHDGDGDTLHVLNLTASSGRLTHLSDGNWLFVAGREETPVITFTYKVSDGTDAVAQQALLAVAAGTGSSQAPLGSGYIVGTPRNDMLIGTPNADVIEALDGDDTVIGREGNDVIFGGAGNDRIVAGDGDDIVLAGAGDDVVFGGKGKDVLLGEEGNDVLMGEEGCDELLGGSGNDVLAGGSDNDYIDAGEGDDRIVAEACDGDDVVDGGEGRDTLDLASTTASAFIDLSAGRASSTDIGSDVISSIENVVAGSGDDCIVASTAQNELSGGSGDDVFVFRTVASIGSGSSRDKIMDFEAGDRIDLDDIAKGLEDLVDSAFQDASVRRFVLLGSDETFSKPGQLKFAIHDEDSSTSVYTLIKGNVDNDEEADFEIEIIGRYDFTHEDFRSPL